MNRLLAMTPILAILLFSACKTKNTVVEQESTEVRERANNGERPARENNGRQGAQGDRKGPPSIDEVFKLDTDGDGQISMSEATGRLKENFTRIDSNGDGKISKEEFQNMPRPQRGGGRGN